MAKTEDYSIENLNDLIKRVQNATSFSENQIEAEINRSYGYLAQTRSRGKVPVALYKLLQSTFKDALQNTRPENGTYKNGNGPNNAGPPVDEVVKAKDETIAALKDQVSTLKDDIHRLRTERETSLARLVQYAQLNHSRLKTIVECQKLLRAMAIKEKLEPKLLKVAEEEIDRIYGAILQETIQLDKD